MDNRSTIVSVALKLFACRGYDGVGVQEIVDAAGITKPTLYHYFGSKRGVLEAALAENADGLYERVREAATYRGDLSMNIREVVRVNFNFAQERPEFCRMLLSMWFAPPESEAHDIVSRLYGRIQRLLEDLFRNAVENHGNMRGRHQRYAATLLGTIHTYAGLWLNGMVRLDDQVIKDAVHQFMHGIFS
jgi:AcrR family transcriptional regulator